MWRRLVDCKWGCILLCGVECVKTWRAYMKNIPWLYKLTPFVERFIELSHRFDEFICPLCFLTSPLQVGRIICHTTAKLDESYRGPHGKVILEFKSPQLQSDDTHHAMIYDRTCWLKCGAFLALKDLGENLFKRFIPCVLNDTTLSQPPPDQLGSSCYFLMLSFTQLLNMTETNDQIMQHWQGRQNCIKMKMNIDWS